MHERLEKYYKKQLLLLKDEGHYSPEDDTHRYCNDYKGYLKHIMDKPACNTQTLCFRMLLAFVLIPLLQKELDTFKHAIWNTHHIRPQKDQLLPHGVPNHIYDFPEEYSLEDCGKYIEC